MIYCIVVFPVAYIVTLPLWAIVVIYLFGGTLLIGLQSVFVNVGLMPFMWIVRNNKIALALSLITVVTCIGRNTYTLWTQTYGPEGYVTAIKIVSTLFILWLTYVSIAMIIKAHNLK
jgi:hypothetical protein